jgi:hypothetical protein
MIKALLDTLESNKISFSDYFLRKKISNQNISWFAWKFSESIKELRISEMLTAS